MAEPSQPSIQKRAAAVMGIGLIAVTALTWQLGTLTLGQQPGYLERAESQSIRSLAIPAPRGILYDRSMTPLATNRPAFRLLMHYPHYDNESAMELLARILGQPVEKLQQRVDKQRNRPYEPVVLADDLTQQQVTLIQEQKSLVPGAEVQLAPVRQYPNGSLAAHLLGYVGVINQEELQQRESEGYHGGDPIGKAGLESFYESVLRGQAGERRVAVNSYAEPLGEVSATAPKPGANLVLALDLKLQRTAERALAWQMHRLQTIMNQGDGRAYQNAKAGAVVVMNPKTGAILAMASLPTFDPGLFVGGISEPDWQKLNENPFQPMLNRAVQAAYHPGSTWKMLTGSAVVSAGVASPSDRVFSGSVFEPTGQRDWVPGGHGWVDLPNALRLSSNIYFYDMGLRLGIDRLVEYAQGFGFGAPTGVDLPNEASGLLPDAAYREENGWWLGQTSSAAIGQIFMTTPVQLAQYVSALANGGKLMQPYLVQSIQEPGGQGVQQTVPKQTGTLPITQAAYQAVLQGMRMVDRPNGTSDFATWPLPGIATAGKTGTAENPPQDDYGLYVGFAPADNPEIAVAVVIEQAGHGGSVSPVARSIYADYFGVTLPDRDPAKIPATFAAP